MSYYMYGSNAYDIDEPAVKRKKKKTVVKTTKNKKKPNKKLFNSKNKKIGACVFTIFALFFLVIYRSVCIHGLYGDVEAAKNKLQTISMENDQLEVSIESMTDDSKVEEYAKENLGLQKAESRQIIYLESDEGDKMQKTSKKNEGIKGVFGILFGD